jgi:hypothetical protein
VGDTVTVKLADGFQGRLLRAPAAALSGRVLRRARLQLPDPPQRFVLPAANASTAQYWQYDVVLDGGAVVPDVARELLRPRDPAAANGTEALALPNGASGTEGLGPDPRCSSDAAAVTVRSATWQGLLERTGAGAARREGQVRARWHQNQALPHGGCHATHCLLCRPIGERAKRFCVCLPPETQAEAALAADAAAAAAAAAVAPDGTRLELRLGERVDLLRQPGFDEEPEAPASAALPTADGVLDLLAWLMQGPLLRHFRGVYDGTGGGGGFGAELQATGAWTAAVEQQAAAWLLTGGGGSALGPRGGAASPSKSWQQRPMPRLMLLVAQLWQATGAVWTLP